MNYAKVIDAALQLFPKKINVTLIHAVSGEKIGKNKLQLDQLPATFSKPATLNIEGQSWRILKAHPLSADDITIYKKLTLHVVENELSEAHVNRYNVATYPAGNFEADDKPLFADFTLDITTDDWLQYQFLPVSALPIIQEEIAQISPLLTTDSSNNPLLGYSDSHIRQQTAPISVNIPLTEFCEQMQVQSVGNIRFRGDTSYIQNGFALQTDNYLYYGLLQNDHITHLCLTYFDCIDDEFMLLTTNYRVALVDWCGARIIMTGDEEQHDAPSITTDPGLLPGL